MDTGENVAEDAGKRTGREPEEGVGKDAGEHPDEGTEKIQVRVQVERQVKI